MTEWGTSISPAAGHEQAFVVDNCEAGNMSILSNPAGSPNQAMVTDVTEPATGKEDQVRTTASRACLSCRRLKVYRLFLLYHPFGHVHG
jgi:hypothetical protein